MDQKGRVDLGLGGNGHSSRNRQRQRKAEKERNRDRNRVTQRQRLWIIPVKNQRQSTHSTLSVCGVKLSPRQKGTQSFQRISVMMYADKERPACQ